MIRFVSLFLVMIFCAERALAHVGSPNVIFEGKAGEYPVRVIVRPPEVIPGIAEITVRVEAGKPRRVTVRPIFSELGRKGSPPADEAKPVRGEEQVFNAGLWFMKVGAYMVEARVEGDRGSGALLIPVNAIATNTRPMSKPYAAMLAALGTALFLGALLIIRSAWGQSLLPPGDLPGPRDRRRGILAAATGAVVLSAGLWGGRWWWKLDENDYKNNRLYQPLAASTTIRSSADQHVLLLRIDKNSYRGSRSPLIPDHGKMMHLFMARQGSPVVFAHLHPTLEKEGVFGAPLPPLLEGVYDFYGDITRENGFAETLTGTVAVPPPPARLTRLYTIDESDPNCSPVWYEQKNMTGLVLPDPDDSITSPYSFDAAGTSSQVGRFLKIVWLNPGQYKKDEQITLKFQMQDGSDRPVMLQNYMGMAGHAIFRKKEKDVFAHVHPLGTFSMASQEAFIRKENGGARPELPGLKSNPAPPTADEMEEHLRSDGFTEVAFPYSFPKAGSYQIWVQMKSGSRVYTGSFHAEVQP